jgi:hypothetical protein
MREELEKGRKGTNTNRISELEQAVFQLRIENHDLQKSLDSSIANDSMSVSKTIDKL